MSKFLGMIFAAASVLGFDGFVYAGPIDTTPPSILLTGVIAGPPKQIQITIQDPDGGLGSIIVVGLGNGTAAIPAFTVGTTSPVVVTDTKIDQTMESFVTLKVTDVAGNTTTACFSFSPCTATVPEPATLALLGLGLAGLGFSRRRKSN